LNTTANRGAGLVSAILLLALSACATPQTARLVTEPGDLPSKAEVAEVPFFPQERYYCGPAALAMVLAWSGLPVTQDDLVSQVYTPQREGSLRSDVLAAARRNGRLAVPVGNLADMLAEIAAGNPVLVFQNLALDWTPQWHFAVAIGYDLETREILLHSGLDERRLTALGTFELTWERGDYWALVVLPPDRLPVSADETAVLRAAAGLERSKRLDEAALAYGAALQRWSGSFGALMGLGNVSYAKRDFGGAEAAFRRAIAARPESPAPWNNLAYALLGLDRKAEAIEAAREAVRLAGDNAAPYRETLEEISGKAG
jgi:tetratricopeptide (TPR) repeat protein